MKVSLMSHLCVGAGHCVSTAPEVFDQDESDGVAFILDPSPPEDDASRVYEAADLCPAKAILVHEEGGATEGAEES